mgnify:CR=1 FL=1
MLFPNIWATYFSLLWPVPLWRIERGCIMARGNMWEHLHQVRQGTDPEGTSQRLSSGRMTPESLITSFNERRYRTGMYAVYVGCVKCVPSCLQPILSSGRPASHEALMCTWYTHRRGSYNFTIASLDRILSSLPNSTDARICDVLHICLLWRLTTEEWIPANFSTYHLLGHAWSNSPFAMGSKSSNIQTPAE